MSTRSEDPLSPEFLIHAYCNGYFPMPHHETEEILWFHPDPRAIIPLEAFHCSKSLRRVLNKNMFSVKIDTQFHAVIRACGDRPETWLNKAMIKAYTELYHLGFAHSVEVYQDRDLVGGVYGLAIAGAFFAESMFYRKPNASKIALFHLVNYLKSRHFDLLEVQFLTPHLQSLGAIEIPRHSYMQLLDNALQNRATFGST